MVEETFAPGMTVSLVARQPGVAPNQLFTWRRLVGSLTAASSGEEVVPAPDYRALQNQVRELHRLLGKKTLEAEILEEALEHATGSKNSGCRRCGRRTIRDEDRGRCDRRVPLEPGGALTAASAEEADRSAAITGRGARGTGQGGNRRIADLRLPARPRHPQAPGAGRGFKAA
jgi:transposase